MFNKHTHPNIAKIRRPIFIVLTTILFLAVVFTTSEPLGWSKWFGVFAAPNDTNLFIPLITNGNGSGVVNPSEWTQHAHDAQRTGYTDQAVETPWRWKWAWNGPNSTGGIITNKTRLPKNVQPITGGGRVYVARGVDGVTALNKNDGQVLWTNNNIGPIGSTPAYDGKTDSLYVTSENGLLYRLNASSGTLNKIFNAGSAITTPPVLIEDRIIISAGNKVFAVNKLSMNQIWSYTAGSMLQTAPSYSASRDLVVVGTQDLFIHAIRNSNGSQAWRVKPTVHVQGDPGVELNWVWQVIADEHGLVLIKYRLNWSTLWTFGVYPTTNSEIRQKLQSSPGDQVLFAMDLDSGSVPFVSNVGNGGWGDHDYLPMGPQPVVKRFPNGSEVVYMVGRGGGSDGTVTDARWDSLFVEMLLDSSTVPGYSGGEVRFIEYNHTVLTDEQPFLSVAGDYLLGGHWMAGYALKIIDRADWRGAWDIPSRISSVDAPHFVTSQSDQTSCQYSPTHYCGSYLEQDGDPRVFPAGFYIYFNQGTIYDSYWGGYSNWVVSNDLILFRSNDGAIVALEHGDPQQLSSKTPELEKTKPVIGEVLDNPSAEDRPAQGPLVIDYTGAHQHIGETKSIAGEIRYLFNNGKSYCLGFKTPHQGAFAILIEKSTWNQFIPSIETLYPIDTSVIVTGKIVWYQGDPVIYVTDPSQIEIIEPMQR